MGFKPHQMLKLAVSAHEASSGVIQSAYILIYANYNIISVMEYFMLAAYYQTVGVGSPFLLG